MKKHGKKIITGIIAAVFGFIIAGCMSPISSHVSPYKAGRLFVVADLITEPVQPKEVAEVVDQVYALAKVDFGAQELMADELIKAQIEELYPDTTPEFRQMIFNVYSVIKIRLADQIQTNVDIPDVQVISEFMRGVSDATKLYREKDGAE